MQSSQSRRLFTLHCQPVRMSESYDKNSISKRHEKTVTLIPMAPLQIEFFFIFGVEKCRSTSIDCMATALKDPPAVANPPHANTPRRRSHLVRAFDLSRPDPKATKCHQARLQQRTHVRSCQIVLASIPLNIRPCRGGNSFDGKLQTDRTPM